ncbi:hypothetical protein VQL36_05010 [Chengkuizengella sp. SCS-71B]|uniref:hypothetical protein n=1 Tax=Chengkuizengella sp. SCS-71B TaxID=3115290 RepID=UPI0032C22795
MNHLKKSKKSKKSKIIKTSCAVSTFDKYDIIHISVLNPTNKCCRGTVKVIDWTDANNGVVVSDEPFQLSCARKDYNVTAIGEHYEVMYCTNDPNCCVSFYALTSEGPNEPFGEETFGFTPNQFVKISSHCLC